MLKQTSLVFVYKQCQLSLIFIKIKNKIKSYFITQKNNTFQKIKEGEKPSKKLKCLTISHPFNSKKIN